MGETEETEIHLLVHAGMVEMLGMEAEVLMAEPV
jgi:hypothetical protein